jgi:L-asparaginase II
LTAAGTVRVTRGGHVESVHRFAWRLHDADGTVRGGGDVGPVFVRSAAKPFQALPSVRAGCSTASA